MWPPYYSKGKLFVVVDVAQLVELQIVVLAAAGSIPVVHPIKNLIAPVSAA